VGVVRYQTGRFTEALEPLARAVSLEPHCPSARFGLALVQWAMGDLAASDATQRKALRRFPFDPFLFQQRFDFLALTGRAAEARSLGALGHRERPLDTSLPMAPGQAALALDALELGGVGRRQAAVDALVAARREGRIATLEAAPWVAALGAPDMALAMLPSYFFGQGPIGSENHDQPGPGALRHCYFLFLPPMAAVWPLAGFRELLVGIGLEAFWRDSRTTPDFRR
jgi:tetratricopeptide (TPR) repeat protein